jgi:hypothetical protein
MCYNVCLTMYRVNLPSGTTIDCDSPDEVQQLLVKLGLLGRAVEQYRKQGPQSRAEEVLDLIARDKITRFLTDMTATSRQILTALLGSETGVNRDSLLQILEKQDLKAVGGAIAGVGRKAKSLGLPHVVDWDRDLEAYRLAPRFLELYRAAGSPPVPEHRV